MKKTLFLLVAFILILKPGVAGSGSITEVQKKCPRRIMVLVERVEPREFRQFIHFEATFNPESVEVLTPIEGMVTDIKVSDGDRVSSGYVLVMLNEGVTEELKSLDVDWTHWKEILRKREHWKERNSRAEAKARKRIDEIEARRNELRTRRTGMGIPAPQGGVVELMVTPGTEVREGDSVARVTNRRRKLATISVTAQEVDLFSPGREIPLTGGLTARVYECRGNRIRLEVVDYADRLTGEPVRFRLLKRDMADRVVLREDRILVDESGPHVFRVDGENARRADLEIEAEYAGKFLVASGIGVGDLLITSRLISRKRGGLDASMHCLSDGKLILVMEKDIESGKYVKYSGEIPRTEENSEQVSGDPDKEEREI